jgi:hypothetical protein
MVVVPLLLVEAWLLCSAEDSVVYDSELELVSFELEEEEWHPIVGQIFSHSW